MKKKKKKKESKRLGKIPALKMNLHIRTIEHTSHTKHIFLF